MYISVQGQERNPTAGKGFQEQMYDTGTVLFLCDL